MGCAGNESRAVFKGRRPSGRGRRLDSVEPGLQPILSATTPSYALKTTGDFLVELVG